MWGSRTTDPARSWHRGLAHALGRVTTVTQYDAATSGTVVDEVGFSFDGWGNVTDFDQDHNSVVNGDAYSVAHAYAKATAGRQTVRRSGTTMPHGDALTYSYSSSGGAFDDAMSRVSGISRDRAPIINGLQIPTSSLAKPKRRQSTTMAECTRSILSNVSWRILARTRLAITLRRVLTGKRKNIWRTLNKNV